MKKVFMLVSLVLIIALAAVPALAQTTTTTAPGTWVSSINIQNVGTGAADVTLSFRNSTGASALDYTINGVDAIPAGGFRSVYVPDVAGLPSGAQYSVVISASQPLEVIANSTSTTPKTAGAYQGVKTEALGTKLYFPGLYKSYYTFNSELVLQNTEALEANVTIRFYNVTTGAELAGSVLLDKKIPGTSSRVFAMSANGALPSGNTGIFSAVVTSDKKLAGVANIWAPTMAGEFADYNGYTGGATTVYVPGLYKNYYGFVSALTVQNIDTTDSNITITWGTTGAPATSFTLVPGQAKAFYIPTDIPGLPTGTAGLFSAKVISTNSKNTVALVTVEHKGKGYLGSYNAPITASTKIGCPVIMKDYYGWFTGTTVQNVGTAATDIRITYSNGVTKTNPNVPAGGTTAFVEITGGTNLVGTNIIVSAVIESTSTVKQNLVAVVNEDNHSTSPADYLLSYTCVVAP